MIMRMSVGSIAEIENTCAASNYIYMALSIKELLLSCEAKRIIFLGLALRSLPFFGINFLRPCPSTVPELE